MSVMLCLRPLINLFMFWTTSCTESELDSFFFFISNKDIYSKTLPYAENHKAERKIQREKKENKEKRKERILITQERTKEHRERITRGESPSTRPVKQRATERS